jgi:CheY-like chemotaxis protein
MEDVPMASLVLIDDDPGMSGLTDYLHFLGHNVERMTSAKIALDEIERVVAADLVFLDVIMASSATAEVEPGRSCTGGMEVFREIRKRRPDQPVIVFSATEDGIVKDALNHDPHSRFVSKWGSPRLPQIAEIVNGILGVGTAPPSLQPFIVHGHDDKMKLDLKNYLQNTLHLPEPIILHEKPNGGRTLIEKLEDYALLSSIIFVLLTPDDLMAKAGDSDTEKRRARQNVIFEMGYFLGTLGRRSGRVLLLHRGPLDIPSDLAGIIYVDIPDTIEAAGEKIRREVEHVRQ